MPIVTIQDFATSNGVTVGALYNYIARQTAAGKPYITELHPPHIQGTPKQLDEVAQRYLATYYFAKRSNPNVMRVPENEMVILDANGTEIQTPQSSENFIRDLLSTNQSLNQELGEWKSKATDLETAIQEYKKKLDDKEKEIKEIREAYDEKAEKMVSGTLYAEAESQRIAHKQALDKQELELTNLRRDFEFLNEKFASLRIEAETKDNELKKFRNMIEGIEYVSVWTFTKWKRQVMERLKRE